MVLQPGEEGNVSKTGSLTVETVNNMDDEVAWTKGLFRFHRRDLPYVMRQLARWYGVSIEYSKDYHFQRDQTFTFALNRNNTTDEIFSILEKAGCGHFQALEINGQKKILISP
jgi:hypothetical protein